MSGRVALGALLVGAGIVWLLAATDVVEVSFRTAVALLLVGLGVAIVLARGRSRLLLLLGVVVALAAVPAFLADEDVWSGGVGNATERPTREAELGPFRQAIGKLTVDLTAPALALDGAVIEASVGVGQLVVVVPADADVTVDAHVGIGSARALGRSENGVDVTLAAISGTSGRDEVDLEVDVGVGSLRVRER